jgi:hypothetical protein
MNEEIVKEVPGLVGVVRLAADVAYGPTWGDKIEWKPGGVVLTEYPADALEKKLKIPKARRGTRGYVKRAEDERTTEELGTFHG